MTPLYDGIENQRAIVIEGSPLARSILASQLREFGIQSVVTTMKASDARKMLEHREFDIILCEHQFHGSTYTGQALLDDLRKQNLLKFSTVFMMITADATYSTVAEAAESALDSYLIKPHTANALADRLLKVRARKVALYDIFEALRVGDFEKTAKLCLKRFDDRAPYWLYAARIGSEVLLRLDRPDEARALFEAILASQAIPWARLGVARAQASAGQLTNAAQTLEAMVETIPDYTDSFDVLGRIYLEQGEIEKALGVYRMACESTPSSIVRLQRNGMMAFYMGCADEAISKLNKATFLGLTSRLFNAQTLVMLAFLSFQSKDNKGLHRVITQMHQLIEHEGGSLRLHRFLNLAKILQLLLLKKLADALAILRKYMRDIRDEDFDLESACNTIGLLAAITASEAALPEAQEWIDLISLRHCTSRTTVELLSKSALGHDGCINQVVEAHKTITDLAQKALTRALYGEPDQAIETLIAQAKLHQNTRLMEASNRMTLRYEEKIGNSKALLDETDAWLARFKPSSKISVLGKTQGREEGGICLRTDNLEQSDAASSRAYDPELALAA